MTAMASICAERSPRELRTIGGSDVTIGRDTTIELTAQEARIAPLAREGLSNAEIDSPPFHQPTHRRITI
jgi:hypothetical protein